MRYRDGSTILPGLRCPACGYQYDAASAIGESSVPKDGDVSLCMACGEPAWFTGSEALGFGLREMTTEERAKVIAQDNVAEARSKIAFLRVVSPTWPKGAK